MSRLLLLLMFNILAAFENSLQNEKKREVSISTENLDLPAYEEAIKIT